MFQRILLILTGMTFLGSCTKEPDTSRVSGNITVLLPWTDQDHEIRLREIELHGIENLTEVRGDFAQFFFAPSYDAHGIRGSAARGRFIQNHHGVYIPADTLSQQLATIYAHLQDISAMEAVAGAGSIVSWPCNVGVETRIRDGSGGLWSNNAFFDGDSRALLMVPNHGDSLPLALNPGILAHEHFHALFHALVIAPLLKGNSVMKTVTASAEKSVPPSGQGGIIVMPTETEGANDDPPLMARTVFLKGINEGLADVWGWLYTGDPDFMGNSFPQFLGARSLKVSDARVLLVPRAMADQIHRIYKSEQPESSLNSYAYMIGTQLSRALRDILFGQLKESSVEGTRAREEFARRLLKALPSLRTAFEKAAPGEELDLKKIIALILSAGPLTETQQKSAVVWSIPGSAP